MKKLIIAAVVGIMTFGAATVDNTAKAGDNVLGTLLGAAGGGFVGSNVGNGRGRLAATAFGALLGAYVGNRVQNSHSNNYVQPAPAYPYNRTTFYTPPPPRHPTYAPRQLTWPRHRTNSYGATRTTTTTTTTTTVRRGTNPWGQQCRRVYRSVQTSYGSRQVFVRECR